MDEGKAEAAGAELHNVQLAVTAAMAEAKAITASAVDNTPLNTEYTIGGVSPWSYLIDGYEALVYGPYYVDIDGYVDTTP